MRKVLTGLVGLALLASCGQQDTSPDAQAAANPRTCVNFLNNPDRIDRFFNPCLGYKQVPAPGYLAGALGIHSDGSIALLALSSAYPQTWRIYRYSGDGTARLSVTPTQTDTSSNLMALQSDGKAIAVSSDATGFWRLKRFNLDGSVDTTFVADGLSGIISSKANTIVVQPDNKILVAGSIYPEQFSVLRYTQDGQLDPSFGSGGYVGLGLKEARAMALQGDGKIVLGFLDENNLGPASELGLLRLNPDGTLDAGFGIGGLAEDTRQIFSEVYFMAIQPDGKIVMAVYQEPSYQRGSYLMRFNSSGTPDTSFGNQGEVNVNPLYYLSGMFLQSDGKIVVGVLGNSRFERYNPDGTLDPSGHRFLSSGDNRVRGLDLTYSAILKLPGSDDRFLISAGSQSSDNSPLNPIIFRYLP